MKQLFRKKDIIMSPVTRGEKEVVEVTTFYNTINNAITNQGFLNICPVNEEDLQLNRINLVAIFENRATFLFNTSMSLFNGNLSNLESYISRDKDCHADIWIKLYNNDASTIIREKIPYIFDLPFYFNIDIMDYSSLALIAMNMSSLIYTSLNINIPVKLDKKEIEQLHDNINTLFKLLTESFINDLLTLAQEARIYFEAGNYVYNENTGNFERGIPLEQEFNENPHTLPQTNNKPVSDVTEKQFRKF